MRQLRFSLALAASLTALQASATSLQVSPVTLEIPAPGAAATVTLRNAGAVPLSAQLRVYRWSQADGEDRLEPATEVVASPPAATLEPKANYTVRIVRLDNNPVSAEETYRLVVDELPNPERARNGAITLVVRYSIPIFFTPPTAAPELTWSLDNKGGRAAALASNAGDRHIRLANLKIKDASGKSVNFGDGLVGYVLSGSKRRFTAPKKTAFTPGAASISADSDLGAYHAQSAVQK